MAIDQKKFPATVVTGFLGAGKTTMLKLCNGTLRPDTGSVHWCGRPHQQLSRRQRRQIGTLWQDLRLVEELSVIQNINQRCLGTTWAALGNSKPAGPPGPKHLPGADAPGET